MTVSDQIIQVLDTLCKKFGLMIDWTSENIFPYLSTLCTKLVAYEIWTSVAWMIMAVIGVIGIVVFFCIPSARELLADDEIFGVVGMIGLAMMCVVCIGCIGTQIMDIIKCVTFPEMYIFEYVQGVLNSGG